MCDCVIQLKGIYSKGVGIMGRRARISWDFWERSAISNWPRDLVFFVSAFSPCISKPKTCHHFDTGLDFTINTADYSVMFCFIFLVPFRQICSL